jgi:MFS family permease
VNSSGQSGVLVLLGVLFTIILAGLDNTIVSTVMPVALPELGSAHLYAWTFAAYMLAAAVSMPIWGPGSDRWGRRRTYLIGIVAFTVGSALCAIARKNSWHRSNACAFTAAVSSLCTRDARAPRNLQPS